MVVVFMIIFNYYDNIYTFVQGTFLITLHRKHSSFCSMFFLSDMGSILGQSRHESLLPWSEYGIHCIVPWCLYGNNSAWNVTMVVFVEPPFVCA